MTLEAGDFELVGEDVIAERGDIGLGHMEVDPDGSKLYDPNADNDRSGTKKGFWRFIKQAPEPEERRSPS